MKMKWLIILSIVLLPFGAYGQIVIPWTKVGSTKADFDRDGKECFEYATTTETIPSVQQAVFGFCMTSKGWTQEK